MIRDVYVAQVDAPKETVPVYIVVRDLVHRVPALLCAFTPETLFQVAEDNGLDKTVELRISRLDTGDDAMRLCQGFGIPGFVIFEDRYTAQLYMVQPPLPEGFYN